MKIIFVLFIFLLIAACSTQPVEEPGTPVLNSEQGNECSVDADCKCDCNCGCYTLGEECKVEPENIVECYRGPDTPFCFEGYCKSKEIYERTVNMFEPAEDLTGPYSDVIVNLPAINYSGYARVSLIEDDLTRDGEMLNNLDYKLVNLSKLPSSIHLGGENLPKPNSSYYVSVTLTDWFGQPIYVSAMLGDKIILINKFDEFPQEFDVSFKKSR